MATLLADFNASRRLQKWPQCVAVRAICFGQRRVNLFGIHGEKFNQSSYSDERDREPDKNHNTSGRERLRFGTIVELIAPILFALHAGFDVI